MAKPTVARKARIKFSTSLVVRVAFVATLWSTTSLTGAFAGDAEITDIALLDRLTWGVNLSTAERIKAIGRERWLDEQLNVSGPAALPKAVQAQIDAMPDLGKSALDLAIGFDQQARSANQVADPEQKKAAQQVYQQAMNDMARRAAAREILRALFAPGQLRERLVWFWFNHFNVHQYKSNIRVLLPDYIEHAIRPHALGRFRDLLSATLYHPAMIRYLDNADNAAGHVNENYAREIMELHTLGVGSGYTQHDVEELARVLTGVGINFKPESPKLKPELQPQLVRKGLFEFNPARHDYGDKVFLGHTIKGRGLAEVEEALNLLSQHPATAAFVSAKLATYFVADEPPQSLVQRMAETFRGTNGDIRAVVATMVRSPEFADALAKRTKIKDPARYILSAVRIAYDGKVILNTGPVQNWLNRLGEGLFNRPTPDGYPLQSSAWNGPGQMMVRFEIARQLGSGSSGLFKPEGPDAVDQPAYPLLQNQLYFNRLRSTLSATTLRALDEAVSPQDWNTLYLSSPEFMH